MTFDEMTGTVTAFIGLQEIEYFNETGFVKSEVNRGVLDLLARTRCVVRCVNLGVTAGILEYVVGDQILSLVDIEDGAMKVNRDSRYRPSFTLIRSDILRVQPTPSEDGEVQVWAVKRPSPMVDPADSPGDEEHGAIPEEYQDAIVTYALWKCADYADDQSASQGERYRILYEGQDGRGGRLAEIRRQTNKRGTARAPRRRVRGLSFVRDAGHWAG